MAYVVEYQVRQARHGRGGTGELRSTLTQFQGQSYLISRHTSPKAIICQRSGLRSNHSLWSGRRNFGHLPCLLVKKRKDGLPFIFQIQTTLFSLQPLANLHLYPPRSPLVPASTLLASYRHRLHKAWLYPQVHLGSEHAGSSIHPC